MITALAGLFISALIAATLFPAASEAVLVTLLLETSIPPVLLVVIASLGNIGGSTINWWLGKQVEHFQHKPWFPVKPLSLAKAKIRFNKYGEWSLLLSWVPVIGDPLTVVTGILEMPIKRFLFFVAIAKIGRYTLLTLVTLGVMPA